MVGIMLTFDVGNGHRNSTPSTIAMTTTIFAAEIGSSLESHLNR